MRDRIERFERALRTAWQVDDERPTADANDAAGQVRERGGSAAGRAHRFSEARHLVVDGGLGRLRGHVARRQAGPAGRDDEVVGAGALDDRNLDGAAVVRDETAFHGEAQPFEAGLDLRAGGVLADTGRGAVTCGDHKG